MDCDKEEATRALALAEDKMRSGDFTAAQKLVLKAQSLFSGLDSLPKMLAVCEVHSSADKKINGLDNWYGILQVMHFADDATIKKQYRKLALLLHPDKNQLPGAEAAFQLIMEATTLLADKDKRSQYDIKRRIYSRTATTTTLLNVNSNPQRAAANSAGATGVINNLTFWTRCEHCGYRYKFMVEYVNTLLYCSTCRRSYIAYNTGFNGVPAQSTADHQEVRNQGPCNTSLHKNVESNGAQPGNAAAAVDKRETLNEKLSQTNGGGDNKNAEVRKPNIEDRSGNKYAELSKSEKGEGKMKNNAEPPKAGVSNQQPEVTEPSTGASMSQGKNKRRKFGEELTKSINNEHKADSKDINRRKSPRKRQQDSYAKGGSSNDYISPPTKKAKSSGRSSKRPDSGGSSSVSFVNKGKSKKNVDFNYQETSATKDREIKGCERRGEPVVMAGKIGKNHETDEKPATQVLPDPDFNNFELTTSCFAVNQVWSLYDPTDGMPRFYARINKVLDSEFKLSITWVDPLQDTQDNSIPIACGIFQDGESEEVDDLLMFSTQMLHIPSDNNIIIYPRKGEIWAVFRGWDMSWSASSEYHKRPYEYDYVEILSDFNDEDGVGVAYLAKVEGFVSLFRRDAQHGVFQLQIPPSEMLRFSHKSPSFKMTGKEREGVSPGCFELDTLALPKDMFKVDVKLDRQKLNGKTAGAFPEASEVEVQAKTTPQTSSSRKQRKKVQDKNCSFSKASDGKCTDHLKNPLRKSRKRGKAVGDLKLRKSSCLFSEINNQATSSSGLNTAEKKSAECGTSSGQPDEFCISGEKMATPKKPEKVTTMDPSSITPDIDTLTGKSKKRGGNDELLSQSRGNGLLTRLDGAIKCSHPQTHVASSCKTRKEKTSKLENQRSWDKFGVDQIWAIYSDGKGMPRKYAQIKEIDTSPEFKLHVAPLELHRPPKLMTHPVCCGCFKLKTGKAEVLAPSSFSHQVKAVKTKINRFEVYPGKGEVWALYTRDCGETEEVEIVEVVETEEQSIQAVPLTTAKGSKKPFYRRSEESKADLIEISKTEVSRFSHQIPALRHERRATRFGDSECWELDPKAVGCL